MFTVSAWKNGRDSSKPTLGLRVSLGDRDEYFPRERRQVRLLLPGPRDTVVELSASFWRSCPELRNPEITGWLQTSSAFPWRRGQPPRYVVRRNGPGRFTIVGRNL